MIERLKLTADQVAAPTEKVKPSASADELAGQFGSFLNESINKLNAGHAETDQLNLQFMKGELSDVHQLAIAGQRLSIGLELTVQVRNKVIEAYQEIMRMQV